MPVRMRNGASSVLSSADQLELFASRSADSPLATVSRGEWSVSAIHSWPRSRAACAISRGGLPPSDQSEWVWQSPRSASRRLLCTAGCALVDQLGQVVRLLAAAAWVMTSAVAGPIPGSARSEPSRIRCSSSAGGRLAATSAARRNARTR